MSIPKKSKFKLSWIQKENIEESILLSIGEASMCWIPKPSEQVFDCVHALKISKKLLEFIQKEIEES